MKRILYWTMVVLLPIVLWAQSNESIHYAQKSFLIAKSTKEYTEALDFSKKLALNTGMRLDLRGLQEAKKTLLSESEKLCRSQGFSYPCYIPRGRYDDGIYISIESSDGYGGFAPGYYMVVVASGGKIAPDILRTVKKYVPDAYVKRTSVYMGCMH